jgi:hypothetical protein
MQKSWDLKSKVLFSDFVSSKDLKIVCHEIEKYLIFCRRSNLFPIKLKFSRKTSFDGFLNALRDNVIAQILDNNQKCGQTSNSCSLLKIGQILVTRKNVVLRGIISCSKSIQRYLLLDKNCFVLKKSFLITLRSKLLKNI